MLTRILVDDEINPNVLTLSPYLLQINVHNLFTCLHLYISINSWLMLFNDSNDSKICITFNWLFIQFNKYRAETDNAVSEFTHSNWITLSYYSSPKHKESAS